MDTDIKLTTLELQIENLIPGILLVAEIGLFFPRLTGSIGDTYTAFGAGTVFIAASYAVGLVSSLISRALVDTLSEGGFRARVFEGMVHGTRSTLLKYFEKNDLKFKRDLEFEYSRRNKGKVAEWNAIYRAAIRTTSNKEEVYRRRAQGRITRNLFFPIILGAILIALYIPGIRWLTIALAAASAILVAVFALFLYAYAELINMTEAYDISQIKIQIK